MVHRRKSARVQDSNLCQKQSFKGIGLKVDLAEWAVGVASTSRPADVLLAVLSGEAVRVVEADLDAHLLTRTGILCV